jgi:hypothetical protein
LERCGSKDRGLLQGYPGIRMDALRKSTTSVGLRAGTDFKPGPPESVAQVMPTWPRRLANNITKILGT